MRSITYTVHEACFELLNHYDVTIEEFRDAVNHPALRVNETDAETLMTLYGGICPGINERQLMGALTNTDTVWKLCAIKVNSCDLVIQLMFANVIGGSTGVLVIPLSSCMVGFTVYLDRQDISLPDRYEFDIDNDYVNIREFRNGVPFLEMAMWRDETGRGTTITEYK